MALTITGALEVALNADLTLGPGAWTWTDATPYARAIGKIQITQGRTDGMSVMPPSRMRVVVDNKGGRWVARNLAGPWYGGIRRNIPIRALADTANYVQQALDTFTRTSAADWGTCDTGQTWVDAGVGGSVLPTDFTVSGGAGIHSVPQASAFRQSTLPLRQIAADERVSLQVSCPVPLGGNLEPGNIMLRRLDPLNFYLCRVQVTTASVVQIVIFRNSTAGGSVTLLGPVAVAGITHSAGIPLKIEAETYGSTIRMRVWQGTAKPAGFTAQVVDPTPLDQAGIAVGIRNGVAAGNTNTFPVQFTVDNYLAEQLPVRFEGRIDELPVSWDPTARDSTVSISASGVFRQMQQGTGPPLSAAIRAMTSRFRPHPVEFWPMEDPAGSVSLASQVGGTPMSYSGLSLASYAGALGCGSLPTYGAVGYSTGPVPLVVGATQWAIRAIIKVDTTPSVNSQLLAWSTTSGIRWSLVIDTGNGMTLRGTDSTGSLGSVAVSWSQFYGKPMYVVINAQQSGSDISYSLQGFDILANTFFAPFTGTLTTQSVGWPQQMTTGNSANGFTGSIGETAVYSDINGGQFSGAFGGWIGNTATNRIAGVCADAQIPVSVADDTTGKVSTLGPQPMLNTLGLIQDAATVDGGILYERGFGAFYLARYERYNRPVDLTLNHSLKQLYDLKPTDDDQTSRNYVVVSRPNGSRAVASNPAHIAKFQLYDEGITLNLQLDSDLLYQAGWRVNLGTVDDIRVGQLTINFAANPELLTAWKRCWTGSRIQILNPPPELGVPLLDLQIEGWTETIDPGEGSWMVTLNLTSALPWQVFELEAAGNASRQDTDDSTLSVGVTASATTLSVATVAGSPLWTTAGGDVPFDVEVDGERITVTAVTGSSSPQSFTVVRGVNGTAIAHSSGAQVSLWQPGVIAL